jgi:hypothetical protein
METEILRGAKVRITTRTAQVENDLTPIADIEDAILTEANHGIRLIPTLVLIAGPIIASAIQILTNQFVIALIACLVVMGFGAVLLRERWLNQVRVRLKSGRSTSIYRTPRIADARLFHAALVKAMELRDTPPP